MHSLQVSFLVVTVFLDAIYLSFVQVVTDQSLLKLIQIGFVGTHLLLQQHSNDVTDSSWKKLDTKRSPHNCAAMGWALTWLINYKLRYCRKQYCSKVKAYNTHIVPQATKPQLQRHFCVTDRGDVQHTGYRQSLHPQTLTCDQTPICLPWMVSTP